MSYKNLLKKVGISIFSGAMALSMPMVAVNALTPGQEDAFVNKYSSMIQDSHASIMSELLHQALITTTEGGIMEGSIFNMQNLLSVVDYSHLFTIVNNHLIDEYHMTWSQQSVIEAATTRFPEDIRAEIMNDYNNCQSIVAENEQIDLLRSFLRISDSIRTELIQMCTINDMNNLNQFLGENE